MTDRSYPGCRRKTRYYNTTAGIVVRGPDDPTEEWPKCPTCNGRGVVNPLTAPEWFFCVGSTTCPTCEGTGDCP